MSARPVLPPSDIIEVADRVIAQVRENAVMDTALDYYAAGHENVHVRWLSKLRGYEVTLRFDADVLDGRKIRCPRCEGQRYDVGSCSLCGNLGLLDEHGNRLAADSPPLT